MAIQLSFRHDFNLLETTLLALARELPNQAAKAALTRTAAAARRDVMAEMPAVFDRPTPFTVNSVRYAPARDLTAAVYISDDAPKGLSPRKYLLPEIEGGNRGFKRSERALLRNGLIGAGQQLVPGAGAKLDKYGNISGGTMVQLLSKLRAFGEQGYRANVSDATMRRLARLRRAVRATRTDVFVAGSRRGGEPLGVWQLVSRGQVAPVLVFTHKQPSYKPRFPFHQLVEKSAAAHWPGEMMKSFYETLARR